MALCQKAGAFQITIGSVTSTATAATVPKSRNKSRTRQGLGSSNSAAGTARIMSCFDASIRPIATPSQFDRWQAQNTTQVIAQITIGSTHACCTQKYPLGVNNNIAAA